MKKRIVLQVITYILTALMLLSGCSQDADDPAQVPVQNAQESPFVYPESSPETAIAAADTQIIPEEPAEEASIVSEPSTEDPTEIASEKDPEELSEEVSAVTDEPAVDEETMPEEVLPSSEPDPAPYVLSYSDDIDTIIASMTLHEKICQMIIVTPAVLTHSSNVTTADLMPAALQNYPVGGMIFDRSNISNSAQLSSMISQAQSCMTIPMIMTLDEEGGRVTRLMGTLGTTQIGAMYSYHELGPDVAAFNAMTIGNDIRRFGFNMDLAPVADVWSNPANTVIGDRAYSTDFDEASTLVAAAVSGFHTSGVACCIKHFPGHGDTSADSHYGSVYVYKTLDEIRANEFKPFISGINAGADAVMIGHLIVADQGNIPALFSEGLLTGVLRGELGFKGVIISDSLQMKAMTDYYGAADIPVMAVSAGCDILLMPTDLELTVSSLETAVHNGVISEERINESVRRILILKKRYM